MKTWKIAWLVVMCVAAAAVLSAADVRSYDKSIELVWDEAVKAARDAELEVTDSDRSEHWFTMEAPKKTLSKAVSFEVRLTPSGNGTQVAVHSTDKPGSKKSEKNIAAFFDALDARMH